MNINDGEHHHLDHQLVDGFNHVPTNVDENCGNDNRDHPHQHQQQQQQQQEQQEQQQQDANSSPSSSQQPRPAGCIPAHEIAPADVLLLDSNDEHNHNRKISKHVVSLVDHYLGNLQYRQLLHLNMCDGAMMVGGGDSGAATPGTAADIPASGSVHLAAWKVVRAVRSRGGRFLWPVLESTNTAAAAAAEKETLQACDDICPASIAPFWYNVGDERAAAQAAKDLANLQAQRKLHEKEHSKKQQLQELERNDNEEEKKDGGAIMANGSYGNNDGENNNKNKAPPPAKRIRMTSDGDEDPNASDIVDWNSIAAVDVLLGMNVEAKQHLGTIEYLKLLKQIFKDHHQQQTKSSDQSPSSSITVLSRQVVDQIKQRGRRFLFPLKSDGSDGDKVKRWGTMEDEKAVEMTRKFIMRMENSRRGSLGSNSTTDYAGDRIENQQQLVYFSDDLDDSNNDAAPSDRPTNVQPCGNNNNNNPPSESGTSEHSHDGVTLKHAPGQDISLKIKSTSPFVTQVPLKGVNMSESGIAKKPRDGPVLTYEGPPPEQGIAWPPGWIKRTYQRQNGASKGSFDSYWHTPQKSFKLQSIVEVRRFMSALEKTNGDEEKALTITKKGTSPFKLAVDKAVNATNTKVGPSKETSNGKDTGSDEVAGSNMKPKAELTAYTLFFTFRSAQLSSQETRQLSKDELKEKLRMISVDYSTRDNVDGYPQWKNQIQQEWKDMGDEERCIYNEIVGSPCLMVGAAVDSSSPLRECDVVWTREFTYNHFPGNLAFRNMLLQQKDAYDEAPTGGKRDISAKVHADIKATGGRFLSKSNATPNLHEVDDVDAVERISKCFRDLTSILKIRRSRQATRPSELISRTGSVVSSDSMKMLRELEATMDKQTQEANAIMQTAGWRKRFEQSLPTKPHQTHLYPPRPSTHDRSRSHAPANAHPTIVHPNPQQQLQQPATLMPPNHHHQRHLLQQNEKDPQPIAIRQTEVGNGDDVVIVEEKESVTLPPLPSTGHELSVLIDKTFSSASRHGSGVLSYVITNVRIFTGWAHSRNQALFRYFVTYGLMGRTLDFMSANMKDTQCVKVSLDLIVVCTHHFSSQSEGGNEANDLTKSSTAMQETVISHGGVKTLLLAAASLFTHKPPNDRAMSKAWRAVWNVASYRTAMAMYLDDAGHSAIVKNTFGWVEELPETCVKTAALLPYVLSNVLMVAIDCESTERQKDSSCLKLFAVRNITHFVALLERKEAWQDDPRVVEAFLKFLHHCLTFHGVINDDGVGEMQDEARYARLLVLRCIKTLHKHSKYKALVVLSVRVLGKVAQMYTISKSEFPGILTTLAGIVESESMSEEVKKGAFQVLHTIHW